MSLLKRYEKTERGSGHKSWVANPGFAIFKETGSGSALKAKFRGLIRIRIRVKVMRVRNHGPKNMFELETYCTGKAGWDICVKIP
jgi:hypothetical protein